MGVEVVHYQNDLQGLRVVQIYKLLYAVCPVELRSPLGNADVTPAGEGLTDDEEVSRPVALVLVVVWRAARPGLAASGSLTSRTSCLLFSSRHTCGRLGS
jgi:hypothetical protein